MTEDLEIVIIELPKVIKYGSKRKEAVNWLEFIKNPNCIGGEIMEKNEMLKKAKEEYEKIVADEKERRMMELRMSYILETNTIRRESYEDGEEAGLKAGMKAGVKKGQKQERIEIAKKMLEANIDLEVIIKITGLTKEELVSLQKGEEKK